MHSKRGHGGDYFEFLWIPVINAINSNQRLSRRVYFRILEFFGHILQSEYQMELLLNLWPWPIENYNTFIKVFMTLTSFVEICVRACVFKRKVYLVNNFNVKSVIFTLIPIIFCSTVSNLNRKIVFFNFLFLK